MAEPISRRDRQVPGRALAISALAFLIPLAGSGLPAGIGGSDLGLLVWISALIPGFLLSYYKGWTGSATALAVGMGVVALSNAFLYWRGQEPPGVATVGLVILGLLVYSLGLGILTEVLHRERKSAEDRALADPLTGLPNRQRAENFLATALAGAHSRAEPLSVVMFDLDYFKRLNDTHGHAAGDTVLRAVADLLRLYTEDGWLSARVGGEEFLSILPGADGNAALEFAEQIRSQLAALDVRWQPLTASAGVAVLSADAGRGDAVGLIGAADAALYRAKEQGRDQVQVAVTTAREPEDTLPAAKGELAPGPRGLVVLPDRAGRKSVRRILELNGLRVEEFATPDEVPLQVVADDDRVTIVVSSVSGRAALPFHADVVHRAIGFAPPHVVFVDDASPDDPLPSLDGLTLVRGAASGDRLLPLLGGILRTPLVRSVGPEVKSVDLASPLAGDAPPLTLARVLVVDDERSNRVALERTLQEIGFSDVTLASTGIEALEVVVERPPDIVVLDLHMPDMDGFEVLAALEPHMKVDGFLPILVVTGDKQWELRQRALSLGAKDFLNKPFDVSELGARVLNLLETRRLHLQMRDMNQILEERVWKRTRELARAKDEILFRLAQAAEYRDDVTGRHAERVGVAASILAGSLGLSPAECEVIRRAAPLHDVGKIAIPDAVLLKEGPLTTEERAVMQSHTSIGARLLSDSTSDVIEYARAIALTHHERWDGAGYPSGLRENAIPLSGRIVAIVDALDALTHARPYKRAMPFDASVARLTGDAGTAFDPEIVSAMERSREPLAQVMASGD